MLPKIDGYTVCEMIRQKSQTPIILLIALDAEDDQVKGFDKLADDYITKPFSIKLVLKRVEALLRRALPGAASDVVRYKEITLSETERKVIDYMTPAENAALTSKLPPLPVLERLGLQKKRAGGMC